MSRVALLSEHLLLGLFLLIPIVNTHNIIDLSHHSLEELQSELEDHEALFIKFVTSYCSHCRAFEPKFRKISLPEENIRLGSIDCNSNRGSRTCNYYGITSYPTLRLFIHGQAVGDFSGNRKVEIIEKWLRKKIKISIHCDSFAQLDGALKKAEDGAVIGLFNDYGEKWRKWLATIKLIRKDAKLKKLQFLHLFDDQNLDNNILRSLDAGHKLLFPSMLLYRPKWLHTKTEPRYVTYSDRYPLTASVFADWIRANLYGAVPILELIDASLELSYGRYRSTGSSDRYFGKKQEPLALIIMYYDYDFNVRSGYSHEWRDQLLTISQIWQRFRFAIGHLKTWHSSAQKNYQLLGDNRATDRQPMLVAYNITIDRSAAGQTMLTTVESSSAKQIGYLHHFNYNHTGRLNKFIHDLIHEPSLSSSIILSSSSSSSQSVLSSSSSELSANIDSFDNIAILMDKIKVHDVLLLMYFRHCKMCIRWLNVMIKLAKIMQPERQIHFMEMDSGSSALEDDGSKWKTIAAELLPLSFPTIYYVSMDGDGRLHKIFYNGTMDDQLMATDDPEMIQINLINNLIEFIANCSRIRLKKDYRRQSRDEL